MFIVKNLHRNTIYDQHQHIYYDSVKIYKSFVVFFFATILAFVCCGCYLPLFCFLYWWGFLKILMIYMRVDIFYKYFPIIYYRVLCLALCCCGSDNANTQICMLKTSLNSIFFFIIVKIKHSRFLQWTQVTCCVHIAYINI